MGVVPQGNRFPVLNTLGINPQVQQFFKPWLEVSADNKLSLKYPSLESNQRDEEIVTSHGSIVPSTPGIWCAGTHFPNIVRHNFLFYSGLEALSFCSMATDWLLRPGYIAFSALGVCPVAFQINALRQKFPNARLHTVFGNDILGRITDCKVALWSTTKDALFKIERDIIIGRYNSKIFRIAEPGFSLSRFEKESGLRTGIRTHKPKAGFSTFYEVLRG